MEEIAYGHHRDIQFQVGDLLYLKLRPFRQKSVAKKAFEKLSLRYFDPFEVESMVGKVGYRLKLPPTAAIYPVFHISQLRKAIGNLQPVSSFPQHLSTNREFILEPESVLGVRPNLHTTATGPNILIK